jgi:diacylglycerol O-acyltransferase
VPVSTRSDAERGKLGNRVAMIAAALPVNESDPARRFSRVVQETRQLKHSGQAMGTVVMEELSDWTSQRILTGFGHLAASRRSFNLVVTNVPGPPSSVYLSGAHMLAAYPLVPLFENQALGVAIFSYDKGLFWGFNADWDAVPDLHDFVLAIEAEFEALVKLSRR